jgi:hypothetical protein
MKLVVLYGPPAVGKLTVARELARITGMRVLHNHLTIDVARAIFDFGSPPFSRLLNKLRLAVIQDAATENIDLVATISYHQTAATEAHFRTSLDQVKALGAVVYLVHLTCSQAALEQRVVAEERARMSKLGSVVALRAFMQDRDYDSDLPGTDTLHIDNTELTPDAAARWIVKHYALTTVQEPRRKPQGHSSES